MTKPIENKLSVRKFGKCLERFVTEYLTERGAKVRCESFIVFDPEFKRYVVWCYGPAIGYRFLKDGSFRVRFDRRKKCEFVGETRFRTKAEEMAHNPYDMYGLEGSPA